METSGDSVVEAEGEMETTVDFGGNCFLRRLQSLMRNSHRIGIRTAYQGTSWFN